MSKLHSAHWLILLKRLAAICLLAALFLPLTQCTQASKREPARQTTTHSQAASNYQTQVFASTADSDSIALTVANVFIFIWPLCLVFLTWLRPHFDENFSLRHMEVLLCLSSFIVLYRLTAFGELLPGGYLAWGALSAYSLITVLRLLSRTRRVWDR